MSSAAGPYGYTVGCSQNYNEGQNPKSPSWKRGVSTSDGVYLGTRGVEARAQEQAQSEKQCDSPFGWCHQEERNLLTCCNGFMFEFDKEIVTMYKHE